MLFLARISATCCRSALLTSSGLRHNETSPVQNWGQASQSAPETEHYQHAVTAPAATSSLPPAQLQLTAPTPTSFSAPAPAVAAHGQAAPAPAAAAHLPGSEGQSDAAVATPQNPTSIEECAECQSQFAYMPALPKPWIQARSRKT